MKYYVRPSGTKYGAGHGRNRSNAWSGTDAINWKVIKSGDSILLTGDYKWDGKKIKGLTIQKDGVSIIADTNQPKYPPVLYGYYVNFNGHHNITLEGLKFVDGGQIRGEKSTKIKIKNCAFSKLNPSNMIFIELRYGNHDWTIDGCTFEYCGNAIYSRIIADEPIDPPNRLTVCNCVFRNISTDKWTDEDGHAVGIQGGSGHRIYNNKSLITGSAICCWAPFSMKMTDIKIYGNVIEKCGKLAIAMGRGIEISGSLDIKNDMPKPGWRSGVEITDNIIDTCDDYGISTNIRDEVGLRGNKITNCKDGETRIWNPFK